MKFRIYTFEGTHRVLHTAYHHKDADEKFANLVASGKYDKVEMKLGSSRPFKTWSK